MSKLLYRPDSKEMMSLARLARSVDGPTLLMLLESERKILTDMLVDATDETQTRTFQGRAQCVIALLDMLKRARESDAPL